MAVKSKATAKGGKSAPRREEKENPWELRTRDARVWGEKLRLGGGTGAVAVRQLMTTLKDSRCLSEVSLRRTCVEALVPAAEVGHRGALAAQAARLMDDNSTVRRMALSSLRAAAGGQRPQTGGAVATALGESLPPKNAAYNLEARRKGADALLRLAPAGDPYLTDTARAWLTDDDHEVRRSATRAIGHIGNKDHIDEIIAQISDPDWRVSQAGVGALEQLVTGRVPPEDRLAGLVGEQEPEVGTFEPGVLGSRSGSHDGSQEAGTSVHSGSAPTSRVTSRVGSRAVSAVSRPKVPGTDALVRSCGGDAGLGKGSPLLGLARGSAVAALGRMSDLGDPDAIQATACRLADFDAEVRAEATTALATLSAGNRTFAVELSAKLLGDTDFRVRGAAGKAMALACLNCDPTTNEEETAFSLAAAQLERPDWRSRRYAANTMKMLGENVRRRTVDAGGGSYDTGTRLALDALLPRLHHTDWSVRVKSVQAIASIAEAAGGSIHAVELLSVALCDADEDVLFAVAASLPAAAPRKSKRAIGLACTLAGATAFEQEWIAAAEEGAHGSKRGSKTNPRQASKSATMSSTKEDLKSTKRSESKHSMATGKLSTGKVSVEAGSTLEAIAETPAEEAPPSMPKAPVEVRVAAMRAVEQLGAPGRSRSRTAIIAMTELFEDADEEVRAAAERAICAIGRGRRTAVDVLAKCLESEHEEVRASAARAFKGVTTERLKDRALKRMLPLNSHVNTKVREAASAALASSTAAGVEESQCVEAAAAVMARFRRGRLPETEDGGSRGASIDGRSVGSRASKQSKMSKVSRVSKASSGKASGKQRKMLAQKAGHTSGSEASDGERSKSKGKAPSEASKGSKASRSTSKTSKTSKATSKGTKGKMGKLNAIIAGKLNQATKGAQEERAEEDRLEREEAERAALLEELEAIENGPKEEDFSHSESDGDADTPRESADEDDDDDDEDEEDERAESKTSSLAAGGRFGAAGGWRNESKGSGVSGRTPLDADALSQTAA